MLGDQKLSDLFAARDGIKEDLYAINQSLEGCEDAIKREIIELGHYTLLSVNWSRVRNGLARLEKKGKRAKSA